MANKPLDDATLRAVFEAVREYGNIQAAASVLGRSRATVQHQYRLARERFGASDVRNFNPPSTDSVSQEGNRCEVTRTTDQRIKTLADLIRVCEIDTNEWEVERWVCNKWEVGAIPRATREPGEDSWTRPHSFATKAAEPMHRERRNGGLLRVYPLFQIKAWLKRKVAVIAVRDEIAAIIADAKKKIRTPAIIRARSSVKSGNCAEISIFDLHHGKLGWAKETGWDNYDSDISADLFRTAVRSLLERVAPYKPERIVLPIGNDFLHYDNKQGTTTAGTPQNSDGRYHKMYLSGRKLLQDAINDARSIAPVDVYAVPGNHDTLGTFHLADALGCYFHTAKDVRIENEPTLRKYAEWGQVMLMFTHGDKGKKVNYPLLMARERPKMWARTKYREAHTGHLHQTQVQEFHGVRVRILPSLSSADSWHADNAFVGNLRASEGFIWNKGDGLIATALFVAPESEREGAA
jgi:hypothetical protein